MTKKILSFVLFFTVICLASSPLLAEEGKVSLNSGKTVKVVCKRLDGKVYFPLRNLAESLGLQYTWTAKNSTAVLSSGKGKIQLYPNKTAILIKGKESALSL